MPEPVDGTSPYLAGLDGLRAIAVVGVIAYHLGVGSVPGGLLGVGMFFVLSGYLITDLLVAEHTRTGGVGLRRFWARRARRLLPALAVMLVATVAWATLVDRGQLPALRSDLPSVVCYLSNWWFIFHHVSYFARFGPPSPVGHLWSLAIEEQFYLAAPLLLVVGLRRVRSRRALAGIAVALAAASALEMALLYTPGADPTRVYDGTDTRAFALLVGVALALVWPRDRAQRPLARDRRRLLDGAGTVALAGVVVLFWRTDQYQPFLYQGGMVLLAVLTAVAVAAAAHRATRLSTVLGIRPLRWIGKRSYGIYLWHYPVIVLTTPVDADPSLLRAVLQVGASLLLAAASWRWVEQPVRHGALADVWTRLRRGGRAWATRRPAHWLAATSAFLTVGVGTAGLAGLVAVPPAAPVLHDTAIVPGAARHPATTAPTSAPSATTAVPPATTAVPSATTAVSPATTAVSPGTGGPPDRPPPATTAPKTTPPAVPRTTGTAPPTGAGVGVTAIGDSLMLDAAPYLKQLLPGIVIDAKVGQQLDQVASAVPALRAEGAIGQRVIIELGTNGPYSQSQLVALLDSLGPPRQVVLVNTRVDRPWQQQVNDVIAAVARSDPHATLVDWYAASAGHPEDFYPDGVHLDPAGARTYAGLLARAVAQPPS